MIKELEALERLAMPDELHISECKKLGISPTQDYEIVKQALQRLESIDNANHSETLECFDKIYNTINLNWNNDLLRVGIDVRNRSDCYDEKEMTKCLDTIKQALLELKAIKETNPNEVLEDLEQLAEMADKCWVSCDVHKWKNTINKALLKSQEQEKVLEIIKENNIDIGLLMNCRTLDEYQYHCSSSKLVPQEFDLLKRYCK